MLVTSAASPLSMFVNDGFVDAGNLGSLKLFSFAVSSKILMEIKVLGMSAGPIKMLASRED